MKKIAVLYKSAYGATKQYAQWIAQELQGDLLDINTLKSPLPTDYDIFIYGGGLYAGSVNGIAKLAKNQSALEGKPIFLFTVGLARFEEERKNNDLAVAKAISKQFSPSLQKNLQTFQFCGGIDYAKLRFSHKLMMGGMIKMLKRKPENALTEGQKDLVDGYGKRTEYFDKSAVRPLLDSVRTML